MFLHINKCVTEKAYLGKTFINNLFSLQSKFDIELNQVHGIPVKDQINIKRCQ